MAVSFMCAAACVSGLISPLIRQEPLLGSLAQMINYSVRIFTSLMVPQVIIEIFGFKYALVISELLQIAYLVTPIYVDWITIVPSENLLVEWRKIMPLKQKLIFMECFTLHVFVFV